MPGSWEWAKPGRTFFCLWMTRCASASTYLEQTLVIGNEWPFVGAWGGSCQPEYEVPLPAWVGEDVWRLTDGDVKEDVWSNFAKGTPPFRRGQGFASGVRSPGTIWSGAG